MLAAPLRSPRNTGQRTLLLGLDQRLPSGGRGDGMAGADQSAKDSEPEPSREKKLPSVGDRQKTTNISRSGDPETSLRGHKADKKKGKWKEKRRPDSAAPPWGSGPTTPLTRPQDVHGCIEADPRARQYRRRYKAHFAKNNIPIYTHT